MRCALPAGLVALLAPACGGGDEPPAGQDAGGELSDEGSLPPGPDGPGHPGAELVIGMGIKDSSQMMPLPADRELEMWAGPQGGYHLFFQVRQRGLDPLRVGAWTRFIDPATGQVVRDQRVQASMVDDGGGWYAFADALFTYVCPVMPAGWSFYDHEFELAIRLEDQNGWQIEHRERVVPVCPPGDGQCLNNQDRGCAAHYD
jgi:hypothetical protein